MRGAGLGERALGCPPPPLRGGGAADEGAGKLPPSVSDFHARCFFAFRDDVRFSQLSSLTATSGKGLQGALPNPSTLTPSGAFTYPSQIRLSS